MELLAEAFTALRRERGRAWNAACDIAGVAGKHRPALKPYGIHDIRRLARRFGIRKRTGRSNPGRASPLGITPPCSFTVAFTVAFCVSITVAFRVAISVATFCARKIGLIPTD